MKPAPAPIAERGRALRQENPSNRAPDLRRPDHPQRPRPPPVARRPNLPPRPGVFSPPRRRGHLDQRRDRERHRPGERLGAVPRHRRAHARRHQVALLVPRLRQGRAALQARGGAAHQHPRQRARRPAAPGGPRAHAPDPHGAPRAPPPDGPRGRRRGTEAGATPRAQPPARGAAHGLHAPRSALFMGEREPSRPAARPAAAAGPARPRPRPPPARSPRPTPRPSRPGSAPGCLRRAWSAGGASSSASTCARARSP